MKHGLIPPNLHFNNLSPSVEPFYDNLHLVTSPEPWPVLPEGVPRRASVNSFGMFSLPVSNLCYPLFSI
jgi:hybrid polyketide synthase/nonribosomal peptide synthetase ACE1